MIETTIVVERDGEEIEVVVYGIYCPGERAYFDSRLGFGHPGELPHVDFVEAEFKGKLFELTNKEIEIAEEKMLRHFNKNE